MKDDVRISEMLEQSQAEDSNFALRQQAKLGDYVIVGCPNCGRYRVMVGDDNRRRCEKCGWCVEDNNYDHDFLEYYR